MPFEPRSCSRAWLSRQNEDHEYRRKVIDSRLRRSRHRTRLSNSHGTVHPAAQTWQSPTIRSRTPLLLTRLLDTFWSRSP